MESKVFGFLLFSGTGWLVYRLLLSRGKGFVFNRFYLLALFLCAPQLLWIEFPTTAAPTLRNIVTEMPTLELGKTETVAVVDYLSIFYWTVTAVLLLRFAMQLLRIRQLKSASKPIGGGAIKIVSNGKIEQAFCFMRTIFLPADRPTEEAVIRHEEAHAAQLHSLDVLAVELLICFFWFNPFFYLLRRELRNVHEYLADEAVLSTGLAAEAYCTILLNHINKENPLQLTSEFNFINTKKRFIMMTKPNKNTRLAKSLSAALFAVIFAQSVSISAQNKDARVQAAPLQQKSNPSEQSQFRKKAVAERNELNKEIPVRQETLAAARTEAVVETDVAPQSSSSTEVQEQIPAEYPGGINTFRQKVAQQFNVGTIERVSGIVKAAAEIKIDAAGNVTDIAVRGENETFNNELLRTLHAVTDGVVWKPATEDGKAVTSLFRLPITMNFE
ncbi:MAG: hypothetical protein EAS48_01670 [Chryseobacterium sp.]|nr:MAG: hypothetical protein EAS48_01670 [Chryseobacterium sp.]